DLGPGLSVAHDPARNEGSARGLDARVDLPDRLAGRLLGRVAEDDQERVAAPAVDEAQRADEAGLVPEHGNLRVVASRHQRGEAGPAVPAPGGPVLPQPMISSSGSSGSAHTKLRSSGGLSYASSTALPSGSRR